MSAKRALNDKLQGSVAAYLILQPVNIWQSYKQKRGCLVHFLRLSAVCWPGASGARVAGTAADACDGRTRRAGSFSREWRRRRPCLLATDDLLRRNFLSPQCRNCSRDPDHAHLGNTHSSPFDRAHTTSYSILIETMRLSCTVFEIYSRLFVETRRF